MIGTGSGSHNHKPNCKCPFCCEETRVLTRAKRKDNVAAKLRREKYGTKLPSIEID